MQRNHNYLATVMQIGQVTLKLVDQHQALYFKLEVIQTVGQAGNNRQLPSPEPKQSMFL